MRIRIVRRPLSTSIDGLQLDRFEPGYQYEVGNSLGALLLAEGWGEPVVEEAPALLVPLDELATPARGPDETKDPANLIREIYPPYLDRLEFVVVAADMPLERRKRSRPKRITRKSG
jgi:hypothetical protein